MERFNSQQDALRTALATVLGSAPIKGALVITSEQRSAVGDLMMAWLQQGLWSIREGTRAASNPREYIVGNRPTDLIQAWVLPRKEKKAESTAGAGVPTDKVALLKAAVEAGLMTREQAAEKLLSILAA